jgi:hypothetical protein
MDMGRTASLGMMTLAVGVAAAGLVPLALATSDSAKTSVTGQPMYVSGFMRAGGRFNVADFEGIVTAAQRPGASRAQAYVSLHGLAESTAYQVVASKRPCSKPAGAASRVFSVPVTTGSGADDAFKAMAVSPRGAVTSARSIRIYDRPPGGEPRQLACQTLNEH